MADSIQRTIQQAVNRLLERGLISVQTAQSFNTSESEAEEPACKRRNLKEEMLRRSTSSTVNEMDDVVMEITNYLSSRYTSIISHLSLNS